NGRPIKSRQQSHDTELSTAENGSGGMCCPQRVAKSNTVGRRVEIEAAVGAITLHPTGLRMMGSGAMAIGHGRNHQKKVIFHFRASRL
ncbi:MAG: hypothetical protein DMF02_07110, partial [Verrucomicrobia bacterium]